MTSSVAAPSPDPRWEAVAEAQDGVLSRRQARLGGVSEDAWQWRLDLGRWRAVLPGVVVCHSGEPTDRQRAWAAVLYAGAGAALSADAALIDLGMRLTAPPVLHVAIPEDRIVVAQQLSATSSPYRVGVHRVRRLEQMRHPTRLLPVVRASTAVLHAAAWAASDRAAAWRIAAAVQQRVVRAADVRSALACLPRLRRRALVRAVLDDVEFGAHAGSELDFLAFLRRHRLPLPDQLQLRPRTTKVCYLDAVWRRQRVAAEIDGAHHMEVGAWDADVLRANAVVIGHRQDGLLLVRFTRGNLRHDEAVVADQLSALLG